MMILSGGDIITNEWIEGDNGEREREREREREIDRIYSRKTR